ncbi:MAG: ribonuclease H-like domain-containing protein [Gammaproteobacteria bacterium]|nr:ribonuclease H-like domain-containing protein [Gammaproteobacteria bacterium]MDE0224502.1 ribonuclease H-like domain-containing protein [Gammaproteobacteria bacterium]
MKTKDLSARSLANRPLLRRSFQHLPGIGAAKEAKLRSEGLRDWNDLLSPATGQLDLFGIRGSKLGCAVEASEEALAKGDVEFFKARLPRREHYRIAASFPGRCVFLDIESTGLSRYYDEVTLVGWSAGSRYEVLIEPTETCRLDGYLSTHPIVVTFNGTLFDLPFLASRFNTDWSVVTHVDLRYLARRAGLTGGQKKIEMTIGFERGTPLEGVSGAEAVGLWFDYKEGDLSALRKLIRYNHADVEGMKFVFERVVERLEQGMGGDTPNGGLFERSRVHFSDKPVETRADAVRIHPYRGRVGPRLTYLDLRKREAQLDRVSIVGIDLTGSEKRKSGWASVIGKKLTTGLVATDAELIEMTACARPFLVSIDSPLSLPAGRLTEFDDDPGRGEYGIVRQAERQLRKRGINVYPALLPSMQRLTRRGVKLATTLRKKGIPVIESYPGAAQDILGIPRKKTSLRHLAEGLRRFGYQSLAEGSGASHDELDAATSALVGQLMLAGYWEALGIADEDYLIVPTVARKPRKTRPDIVLGLSGPMAAGKTTAAGFLERRGFRYCRFSEVLEEALRDSGKPVNRSTLQVAGEEAFNSRFGQRRLQNKLAKRVEGAAQIVVDGLRHPEDWAFMRERWGFAAVHVHIGASAELRSKRYAKRSGGSSSSFRRASSAPVEQNVLVLERLADHTITNTRSLDELETELNGLVRRWSACR